MLRGEMGYMGFFAIVMLAGASLSAVCMVRSAFTDVRSSAATHERVRTCDDDADEATEDDADEATEDVANDTGLAGRDQMIAAAAESCAECAGPRPLFRPIEPVQPSTRDWVIPRRERRPFLDREQETEI